MPKKPAGIAVDVDLHTKVKSAAAERGTNLERAYNEALKMWLGEDTPAFRGKYAECHELLEVILRRGNRDAASAMKSLLKTFGEPLLEKKD